MASNLTLLAAFSSDDIERIRMILDAWAETKFENVLFVCTANFQRSKTCEDLFNEFSNGLLVKSAGVSRKECSRMGTTLCTEKMLADANIIYVFEELHSQRINEHTSSRYQSKLVNLDIPDQYKYMSTRLIDLVLTRISSQTQIDL